MACFCTLASGSSGNSTYIGSGVHGILVDVGISCKAVLSALDARGIDRESIGAVFITHEHTDHIKGLKVLLKKIAAPVVATEEVLCFLADRDYLPPGTKAIVMPPQGTCVGDMYIAAFDTSHDSAHSVGYVAVSGDEKKMAVSTDLGVVTPVVRQALAGCDLILMESNYDRNMLMAGNYPYALKRRIDSASGHLSNADCADFLPELIAAGTTHIQLGHLSQENNMPRLAKETALAALIQAGMQPDQDYQLGVAPRFEPGNLIRL